MPINDEWIDKFVPLEIYSFPFRFGNLLFLLFFTLWFSWIVGIIQFMGVASAVMNMGMAYTGLTFFVGYMFIITEYTAQGYQHIPSISGTIFTSEKPRLFKLVFLVLTLASLFLAIDSTTTQFLYLCFCMLFFPIATSILVWDESLISMVSPAKWLRVISGIATDSNSLRYMMLQTFSVLLVYPTLNGDMGNWLPLSIFCLLATWTTMFRLLGVILHTNADTLGIVVRYGPKVEEEQKAKVREREINDFSSELYALTRSNQGKKALEALEKKLVLTGYRDEGEYFQRFCKWEDPAFALNAGQKYLERLVNQKDYRTTFDVLEFCFEANNQNYIVKPASIIFKLAEKSETRNQRVIVTHLLEHFEEDFERHPKIPEALLMAAEFSLHHLDDWPRARKNLSRLREINPRITTDKKFRTLAKLLNTPS